MTLIWEMETVIRILLTDLALSRGKRIMKMEVNNV